MKRALLALFLLGTVGGTAAAAPPRGEVERLLAGYEVPARGDDWKRLGPGVDRVLVTIALDPQASPIRRNRALSALALFPSSEGRELLRAVVRDHRGAKEGMELVDLVAAVRAFGGFGESAATDLVPLLTHPHPDVRATAALALGRAGAVSATGSLQLRLTVERDEEVVAALRRAVATLQAPR